MFMNTGAKSFRAFPKGSNCPHPQRRMLYQPHGPTFEGRWLMTTRDQLEVSEQADCGTAFEDGINQDYEGTGPWGH